MVNILFNDAEPFEQIDNTPLTESPMGNQVKICQAVSEKKTFKDYYFKHVYSPGARVDNPWGQKLCYNQRYLLLQSYIVSFSHWSLIHFEKLNFQYLPHTYALL